METLDVAWVPSSFPVGFELYSYGDLQFVTFYDADHYMTIACRKLDSKVWDFQRLDSKVGWDSHNSVIVKVDAKELIHVVGNMHASPLNYFRSAQPLDIHSLERIPQMTGIDEDRTTYPAFMDGPNGEFIFHYRQGGSGNGYEIYNVWDADRQTWSRMLDAPLIDGLGERNAYMQGPVTGPDGFFHLIWVWRETPDCATNHTLSYARSKDLIHWESIDSKAVPLPITIDQQELWVDDTPPGGGLFNPGIRLSFDHAGKVMIGYHKYDEKMNTQLFIARYVDGAWSKQQVTCWDFPWNFQGNGSIDSELIIDTPKPLDNNRFSFGYNRKDTGRKVLILDATTLKQVGEEPYIYPYSEEINIVESTFPRMMVNIRFDSGKPADGKRYMLRWESLPANRDRKLEGELPPPSMLKVISSATNPDIETIRGRIVSTLMAPAVDDTRVKELMTTLRNDGTWPGIDYADVRREAFQHTQHLSNMLLMSRAYKKKGSAFYGKRELKNAIYSSLDYWIAHDYICDNWWNNEIGTPDVITAMLLILDKDLTPVQVEKALAIAGRSHINAQGARQSGDRIKIAGIQAKYTLFKRDVETFEMLMKVIEGEIRFVPTNQRGMQYDYSFHHRDDHVNNTLSYGLGYADAFVEWTAYLSCTRYQLAEQAIKQLVDYYLDGICKQMVDGKYPDPSTANRDISRPGHGGAMGARTPERLLAATDYRKDELQQIVNIRQNQAKSTLSYGKFFWLSECYVHQRPGYFTSVRMFSNRNANMEAPYNSEGLTNHHRGDGTNYISLTGTEYFDMAPVNDWQKIPGATIMQKASLPDENQIQKYGEMDFVGAVTDGMYGAVGFDFISPHDPLHARKAWFFFDSEYVCLGAGIRSQTDNPVATTINQCLLNGEVTVNAAGSTKTQTNGESPINDVRWVFHDGVGYIFPEPVTVHLKNQPATGSWYSINRQTNISKDEVRMDVFKLHIDHGSRPNGATYQYIVMPSTSMEQVASAAQTPAVTILSNTPEMQAVWHNTLNILQLVCYKNGTIQLSGGYKITMDSPGILMAKVGRGSIELSVADPSRKLGRIHFSVNYRIERKGQHYLAVWNEAKGVSEFSVDLPQEGHAGESVTIHIEN